jgi:hypothetical protein
MVVALQRADRQLFGKTDALPDGAEIKEEQA